MHLLPAQGRHGQAHVDGGPIGGAFLVRGRHGLAFLALGRSRVLAAFGQGQIFVQLQLAQAQGAFHGEHVPEVQAQFRPQGRGIQLALALGKRQRVAFPGHGALEQQGVLRMGLELHAQGRGQLARRAFQQDGAREGRAVQTQRTGEAHAAVRHGKAQAGQMQLPGRRIQRGIALQLHGPEARGQEAPAGRCDGQGKVLHTRGHAEEPGLGIQGQGPGQRTPGGEQIIGEIAAQDGVLTVAQVLYRKVDVAQVVALAALLHMQAALAQGQAAQLQRQEHLAAGLVTGGITGGRIRRRGGLAFRQQQTQRRAVQTDFADDQLPVQQRFQLQMGLAALGREAHALPVLHAVPADGGEFGPGGQQGKLGRAGEAHGRARGFFHRGRDLAADELGIQLTDHYGQYRRQYQNDTSDPAKYALHIRLRWPVCPVVGLQDKCRASPVPRQAGPPLPRAPCPGKRMGPQGWPAVPPPCLADAKRGSLAAPPSYSQTGP